MAEVFVLLALMFEDFFLGAQTTIEYGRDLLFWLVIFSILASMKLKPR